VARLADRPRPVVSVLLPVRHWRSTTEAAVTSLLAQTLHDIEILIIGQDDVDAVMARLPKDARLRGLSRFRPGIVGALDTGLAEARGKFIARMDDDDIAYPARLETQLAHLECHPDIAIVGARVRIIDAAGGRTGVGEGFRRYESWLNGLISADEIRDACFIECPLPHPTWIAAREIWSHLGGYRDIDGPEDHDFILRARNAGLPMSKPDPVLLDWREHPGRLTHEDPRYRREAFTRLRAAAAVSPASGFGIGRGRAVWICGTGRNARWWFDALQAHDVTVLGFVDLDRANARQRKRHRPVITYGDLWTCRGDALLITAVTNVEARQALVASFTARGMRNGRDYLLGG